MKREREREREKRRGKQSVDVAVTFPVSSLEKSSRARNRDTFVSSLAFGRREKSIEGIVEVAWRKERGGKGKKGARGADEGNTRHKGKRRISKLFYGGAFMNVYHVSMV